MPKPGPKPKPAALTIIQGNPGKRPINDDIPVEPGMPSCPDHLSDLAIEEWDRMSVRLFDLGLLTHLDRAMLAAYCQAWGRWVSAENNIAKTGSIVKTKNGNVIQNPHLSVSNRAYDQVLKTSAELGLSPSSRVRVAPAGQGKGNPFTKNGRKPA